MPSKGEHSAGDSRHIMRKAIASATARIPPRNIRTGRTATSASAEILSGVARLLVVLAVAGAATGALAATARLAQRTVMVPVRDLMLPVPVSGDLTYKTLGRTAVVDGKLQADLAAAQGQSTALLRALIDRNTPCGDRIAVREGQINARAPALRVTGTADYQRTVCIAGSEMSVVPRSPIHLDMLLHPVVQSRSLRVRAQVLDVRGTGPGIPASAEGPLKETLGKIISERIGELLPAGAMPADAALKSVSFYEAGGGGLMARVEFSGSLPQQTLDRLIGQR